MVLVEERLAPKWRMGTYTLFSLLARRRIVLSPPDLLHVLDQVATIAAAKDPWRAGSVLETVVPVIERSVAAASAEDQAQVKVALADLLRTVQTRNTLRVATPKGEKTVPKHGTQFTFDVQGGQRVAGDDLLFRPEDRIKKAR